MEPKSKYPARDGQIAVMAEAGVPLERIGAVFGITRQRAGFIARSRGVRKRDWGPGHPAQRMGGRRAS
jgi:hypothetical protein